MAAIVCGLLIWLAVLQLVLAACFVRALLRPRPRLIADSECGRALAVLSLRGSDPFLRDCVLSLVRQDYPRFDIRIVIDGRDDPAWEIVESAIDETGTENVQVESLKMRRDSCSLKCSSVLQAVANVDSSYAFVAQLDADTVPHRTWLRELATALGDPSVGAATGNRWYFPSGDSWGSLVRYVWNAAAVVQMFAYRIAWGGTLAVKTELLQTAGLRDRWGRAFCEDTLLHSALRPLGLRVAFVPSLMMVNRENCSLPGYEEWVRRQLLTARLYHPAWPAVFGHGLLTSVVIGLSLLVGLAGIIAADSDSLLLGAGGLAVYQVSMLVGLAAIEWSVRRLVRARGESAAWLTAAKVCRGCLAVPLTQLVYARSLLAAAFLRTVTWRGVRYEVDGPWQIRLAADQGLETPGESLDSL